MSEEKEKMPMPPISGIVDSNDLLALSQRWKELSGQEIFTEKSNECLEENLLRHNHEKCGWVLPEKDRIAFIELSKILRELKLAEEEDNKSIMTTISIKKEELKNDRK
jgi:hypothetical protein